MKIYLVGGCVRDKLLGIEPKDLDYVVVGGNPEYFLSKNYQQVGADFPVFLHPETKDEYALARKERKVGDGYHGFECQYDESVSLEEDLMRRDLTINSMAMDDSNHIIDPFMGKRDLVDKKLRHVSNHFREDPLRVLRVARFLARYKKLGFSIHPNTMDLMKEMTDAGELNHLTPERIKLETDKALLEHNPEEYFYALKECGALKIVFPEINDLFGVPQPSEHHPEIDSGIHTMMVLQQARKIADQYDSKEHKLTLLWSSLLHDLGKAITPKDMLPRHIGHEKAGVPIIESLADRIKLSSKERYIAKSTSKQHLNVHKVFSIKTINIYEKILKPIDAIRNPINLRILVDACKADARGRTGFEDRDYPQRDFLITVLDNIKNIDQGLIAKKVMDDQSISKEDKINIIKENIKNRHIQCIHQTRSFFNEKEKYFSFFKKIINEDIKEIKLNELSMLKSIGDETYVQKSILSNFPKNEKIISIISDFSESIRANSYKNFSDEERRTFEGSQIGKRISQKQEWIIQLFLKDLSNYKKLKRKIDNKI